MQLKMSSEMYSILKHIAQYVLPGLGTLYFALSGIWGLPYGEQIIGTISAVTVFLSTILGISSYQYDKNGKNISGTLYLNKIPDNVTDSFLKLDKSEEEIAGEKTIKLRVQDSIYPNK